MTTNNNHILFVGSYGAAHEPGIFWYNFNADTGGLSFLDHFSGVERPSFLTIHPNGRWLYAVSEIGVGSHGQTGAVWAFDIARNPIGLTPLNHRTSDGDWPCHLVIDRTGNWLMTTNYGSGDAALYPIETNGSLGEMRQFVKHAGSGPNEARQEGPHAHSAIFTPDNNYVIVADLGIDQLVIYRFDADTGTLSRQGEAHSAPGAGPRHMVFHPDGLHLYVANELDSTVTRYRYEATAGTLTPQETLSTLPTPDPENTVADIHLSDDGKRLYVSNRGHNSIAAFGVAAQDGKIGSLPIFPCGGDWPRNFALAPGGRFLLVANQYSGTVVVMHLEDDGASLSKAKSEIEVPQASCLAFL